MKNKKKGVICRELVADRCCSLFNKNNIIFFCHKNYHAYKYAFLYKNEEICIFL